jgi:Tfp pilus assembly protein FimT
MVIVLTMAGVLLSFTWPRVGDALDRLAVTRAASEITTAIAITRHRAIAQGTRARITMGSDSLVIDTLDGGGGEWGRWRSWPGPQAHAVRVTISNPVIVFQGSGLAWGFSNTRVVLERGGHSEMITTSRVGRVKRW